MQSLFFLLIALPCSVRSSSVEWPTNTFADRVVEHDNLVIGSSTENRTTYSQVVLAYHEIFPLDEHPLQELLKEVGPDSGNSDFAILVLLRILYFTARTNMSDYYDNLILPVLKSERYWYTTDKGVINDDTMNSENHMILWMSSSWLLQERESWDLKDATLRQRLVHYLTLKSTYGYYEFLSITYLPYSFGALLNLVDFSEDSEIRRLAESAVRRLVLDYMKFVNSEGIHFTAAGRDYAERFISPPHTQYMDAIVYLISGLGRLESGAVALSCFLTTSKIDFTPEAATWQPSLDMTYSYGHTLEASFEINSMLEKYDRVVFQMSQGGYMHPLTVGDTVDFVRHYGPIRFNKFLVLDGDFLPDPPRATALSKLLKRLTYGLVCSGNSIQLYRQNGSMLTSVQNFWPGHVGGQTFPWIAVADDVPVWTQSGLVREDWLDKPHIANSHLPMIKQEGNVALIVYRPLKPMPSSVWGDVALHWVENRFDETRTVGGSKNARGGRLAGAAVNFVSELLSGGNGRKGSWILGRRNDSYVAVYRPCGGIRLNGWYTCSGVAGRQVWAVVVGDASRYGTFDAFATIIDASATVTESYDWRLTRKPLYTTSVTVEATNLRYEW